MGRKKGKERKGYNGAKSEQRDIARSNFDDYLKLTGISFSKGLKIFGIPYSPDNVSTKAFSGYNSKILKVIADFKEKEKRNASTSTNSR